MELIMYIKEEWRFVVGVIILIYLAAAIIAISWNEIFNRRRRLAEIRRSAGIVNYYISERGDGVVRFFFGWIYLFADSVAGSIDFRR